jgi:hypothetical protein
MFRIALLATVLSHIHERSSHLLDPIISPSSTGIEMEGIGGRLIRDGHAELNADHKLSSRESANGHHLARATAGYPDNEV